MTQLVVALLPIWLAATDAGAARAFSPEDAPPELVDAVRRADGAAQALQRRLSGRLMEVMKQGGPAAAVNVCRDEARTLTDEAARESGAIVGRTSDRLRNPKNVPPPWAESTVASAAGKRAADVRPVAFAWDDKVGVLRPITVGQACTGCHGRATAVPAEVAKALRASYPLDRAIDYAEGDHRGFVWVVVSR